MNIEKSLILIEKFYQKHHSGMFCASSGGKDSTVILDLVLQVNPNIMIVHNPKNNTHVDTVQFLYTVGYTNIVYHVPSSLMSHFIVKHQLTCQIDGTRISEYTRTDKSSDLIINNQLQSREQMTESCVGIWGLENLYPIYDWSDEDVFDYCRLKKIPLSSEYDSEPYWARSI